jgi:hypothetical protein
MTSFLIEKQNQKIFDEKISKLSSSTHQNILVAIIINKTTGALTGSILT